MHHVPELLSLPDGRQAQLDVLGADRGPGVVFFHGCPDTRHAARFGDAAARRAGVRLVAVNRPGYGRSDPAPNLSLQTWADDYAELHGLLGLPPCPIVGWSGGGPYALACAVRAPALVSSVGLAASSAPAEVMDEERHLADLSAGDFFGEMALLDEERRSASVRATSPMRLMVMTRQEFHSMIAAVPGIDERIRAKIAERLDNSAR